MRVARLGDIEGIPVPGQNGLVWTPVRNALGIEAFGINAYTAHDAGQQVVEAHDELGSGAGHHEELYVVVSGRALFTVEGEEVDAPAGTLVFLDDPAERRAAVAREPGTTVLAIGGVRDRAFAVSPWESSFRAIGAGDAGDRATARRILEEGLVRHPGNPSLLYNLACQEALDGDAETALRHLGEACAADAELRGYAQADPDLAAIRDDSRFPKEDR
jgi:hypothetical protein